MISFSDALFAFSITFMTLSIQLPNFSANIAESDLTRRLSQMLVPSIIHYIISFTVVGIYWISYHRIFKHIRHADITLIWLNLLFLLFISLAAYFTGLLTTYSTHRIVVIVDVVSIIKENSGRLSVLLSLSNIDIHQNRHKTLLIVLHPVPSGNV